MRDVTDKYKDMIMAFEADFNFASSLMARYGKPILKNDRFIKDKELMNELDFNLRHNKIKIIEEE